jgi:hypothetical protein
LHPAPRRPPDPPLRSDPPLQPPPLLLAVPLLKRAVHVVGLNVAERGSRPRRSHGL